MPEHHPPFAGVSQDLLPDLAGRSQLLLALLNHNESPSEPSAMVGLKAMAGSIGQVWQLCLLAFSVHLCPAHRYCPTSTDPKGGNPMQAQDRARFGRVVQAG